MVEPLGKIEKPDVDQFTGKRKLCLVALIFSGEEAPAEYVERFNRYWEQVSQHIANLEAKIGKVQHIYYESIARADEEGLKVAEKLSPSSYQIIQEKCQRGAVLEITEDRELTEESIDWERCLLMGLLNQKVAEKISGFYLEALRKRYEYIAQRINETLKANEVGILFIREGHSVQFPQDIEVFLIAPPALDEIRRWQRDRLFKEPDDEQKDEPSS